MCNKLLEVDLARQKYPKDTLLKLTAPIEDKYTPKEVGDIFKVDHVDDKMQIHGSWASGGSMAIIIGEDEFEIYTEEDD